jgi:hypothetical protein
MWAILLMFSRYMLPPKKLATMPTYPEHKNPSTELTSTIKNVRA